MLSDIKEKARGIAGSIVVVILAIVVCLGGIQFYSKYTSNKVSAATVDGYEIDASEIKQALSQHKYILSQLKDNSKFNLEEAKSQIVKGLIDKHAVLSFTDNNKMKVPPLVRDTYIRNQSKFQVNGKFDEAKYLENVTANFGSERNYLQRLNQDLIVLQLKTALTESVFVLPYELKDLTYLYNELRDISYITLTPDNVTITTPSSAKIEEYYNANKQSFATSEQVKVSYVLLSKKEIAANLKPTTQELKEYFTSNIQRYPDVKEVDITLYDVVETASGDEKALKVLKKSLSKDSQVEKYLTPDSSVSISYSGWKRLDSLSNNIAETVYGMKSGDITSIETSSGTIIIQLKNKRMVHNKLDDIKKRVISDWINDTAEKNYSILLDEIADLAYTADNLMPVSKKLNLPIKTTSFFTEEKGSDKISRVSAIRAAAFSEDVLDDGLNSSPIKISDNEVVVIHLKDRLPARQKSIVEVNDEVKKNLSAKNKKEALEKTVNDLTLQLSSGVPITKFINTHGLTWTPLHGIKREGIMNRLAMEIKDDVFNMPRPIGDNYSYKAIKIDDGKYIIAKLLDVRTANPLIMYPSVIHDKYINEIKTIQYDSFRNYIKDKSKVYVDEAVVGKIN